jgi:hypothetical protein
MNGATPEARARLERQGMTSRDVALPDEPPADLRMGSLRVERRDGSFDIVAWDYGMQVTLVRCRTLGEAVSTVEERWRTRPQVAQEVPRAQWDTYISEMTERMRSLTPALDDGRLVRTTLPAGSVVDRFGNLDGFLLFPAGTPMAHRSLPPSALDPDRPNLGLLSFGVVNSIGVVAKRIGPAFGQPGGGVLFKLADDADTVRELLQRGDLMMVTVTGDG